MPQVIAAIAIGSNVGDRGAHVAYAAGAIGRLPETAVIAMGPVIRTVAVGRAGVEAGGEYLNSCVLVRTGLDARGLLERLHEIERARGRDRPAEQRWGPRTLDLDLLVYGETVIEEPGLTVPHPRLHERRFVLEPLAAIAPEMIVPGRGSVADLLRSVEACATPSGG
jgi:2-amino-4-hydroxy-6-hydroxymethyldihydropteridine diphosphokinase